VNAAPDPGTARSWSRARRRPPISASTQSSVGGFARSSRRRGTAIHWVIGRTLMPRRWCGITTWCGAGSSPTVRCVLRRPASCSTRARRMASPTTLRD